ncbi:MAG: hypothetical protein ABJP45_18470 [Cyclobacteriaceae bacterium]
MKTTASKRFDWLIMLSLFLFLGCDSNRIPNTPKTGSSYTKVVERLGIEGEWEMAARIAAMELQNLELNFENELFFLFALGDNYRFLEKYELSERYFKEVIAHPVSLKYPEYRGEAFYGLGDLYYIKWGYFKEEEALEMAEMFLDSSMAIARTNNLQALESKNLYRSGSILQIQGEHDLSIANFRRGLEISFAIADTAGMIRNDVHKAAELERQGLLDSALFHDSRSYQYAKKQNRNYSEAHSLCNLGQFYFNLDQLDSAEHYFIKAEFLSEELNQGIVLCRSYYNLCRFYSKTGNIDLSKKYWNNGLSIAKEKGYKNFEDAFTTLGDKIF